MSKKGTWKQALFTFLSPLVLILVLRWAIVEPFVIPSESMVPNLLVHDHIVVKKFSFGLNIPFTDIPLIRWGQPSPGDIIVFKYPANPSIYYVKRLVGVPGDTIEVSNGRITRNGEVLNYQPLPDVEYGYSESFKDNDTHAVIIHSEAVPSDVSRFVVPEKHFFMMGDNRDNSSDSRLWGFVPEKNLVGKAWMIWLSCEETLADARFICDPLKMRWNRIFNFL